MNFNDRPTDVFISYAHEDTEFARQIDVYLDDIAGLNVWRDERMPGAAPVADAIHRNIQNSRALILIYSAHSSKSQWVLDELRKAIEEKNSTSGLFRIIGIILDGERIPSGLSNHKCLHNERRKIDLDFGFALLSAFYPFQDANTIAASRDVYISRSWRDEEAKIPDTVCEMLINSGFRLVGDAKDWKNFDSGRRVEEIITSCGALVAVAPPRPNDPRGTSKYILQEIEIARRIGLPYLIVADEGVPFEQPVVDGAIDSRVIRVSELDLRETRKPMLGSMLFEDWREPKHEHHGFLAANFKTDPERSMRSIAVAERVTGMRCLTGRQFQSSGAQQEIIDRISKSVFFIGDLSDLDISKGNVLVEIGVALGARVDTEVIAIRNESRPHADIFMFRGREIKYASNDAEFIARVHAVCRRYRRRIFNWEFEEKGLLS